MRNRNLNRLLAGGVIAGVIAVASVSAGQEAPEGQASGYRVWTSTAGSTLEARLVFNYGEWIRLAERDGSPLAIKVAFLSESDRAYLRDSRTLSAPPPATAGKPVGPRKLDINSASFDELKFLPRIGDTLAERIIKGRPYRKVSDLLQVEGIGPRTYDGIRREVTARKMNKRRSDEP